MQKILLLITVLLLASCASEKVTISVVGTNDVHGELLPAPFSGGLTTLSGYVAALRVARAADGGAVLLIDAGDMWQGTLESNLVEGESVVQAYNAMGYTAATIGNHEFDFGPVGPRAIPGGPEDDPRGALKQRISEAEFPVLSANIIDSASGEAVSWEDVTPSIIVDAAGVKVGIVGLITANALAVTATANTVGLEIAPLAETIIAEAEKLRAGGATIVIVTSHAGGRCEEFGDPMDISSCNLNDEMLKVALALPPGLVDHIIAGHAHDGIAHVVNGIAVTSAFSNTYAFDRVDFTVDTATGTILEREVFPPQLNCPAYNLESDECEWVVTDATQVRPAVYEGITVEPTAELVALADAAIAHTEALKSEPLGVILDADFKRDDTPESAIAQVFTDAILEGVDADISIHNVSGGIRADLDAGPVTYGDVYEISPFDNQVVVLDMSGADLRRIIAAQAVRTSRRAGFSGMQVFASCDDGAVAVQMILNNGEVIADDDRIRVSTNDFLATLGDGVLSPGMPEGGYQYEPDSRMSRDLIVDWFKKRGGTLSHREFATTEENRRWNFDRSFITQCANGV